jgi:hypothetical protein
MDLIVIGVLVVLGGIAVPGYFIRRQHNRASTISQVPQYDCAQIAEHGKQAPGMRVSVRGRVRALDSGALRSPVTERECAWYQLTISERIRERRDNSTSESEKVVSQEASVDPILVTDDTGTMFIEPDRATIDRGQETHNRLGPAPTSSSSQVSFGKFTINLSNTSGVVGIRTREVIIPIGADIYVLGGAYDRDGTGIIAAPREGQFIISLRSAEELARHARRNAMLLTGLAAALAVVGLLFIVAGFRS